MKKRSKYRPKPCVLPLGIRKAVQMEMPGYQASMALGQAHFCESHLYDLLSNADMTRRIAPDGYSILPVAQSMVEAIAGIQARHMRAGVLGVTGNEFRALREGVALTMDFLRAAPNVAIDRAARSAVAEFDRAGALRV